MKTPARQVLRSYLPVAVIDLPCLRLRQLGVSGEELLDDFRGPAGQAATG